MFCKNCGKELANDAKFCDGCGATMTAEAPAQQAPAQQAPVQQAPVQQAPVQQVPAQQIPGVPVQPGAQVVYVVKQPNPAVENFVSVIKSFWTNPSAAIRKAAASNTHEWSIFALIAMIAHALGAAVVGLESIIQWFVYRYEVGAEESIPSSVKERFVDNINDEYSFFGIFGIGALIGVVAFMAAALGLWLLVTVIFKKQATFIQAMNVTAIASIPLSVVHIVNMLFGLVWAPLAFIVFFAALIMCIVLLYEGVQSFAALEKSPLYAFIAVIAAIALVLVLFGMLYPAVSSTELVSSL